MNTSGRNVTRFREPCGWTLRTTVGRTHLWRRHTRTAGAASRGGGGRVDSAAECTDSPSGGVFP